MDYVIRFQPTTRSDSFLRVQGESRPTLTGPTFSSKGIISSFSLSAPSVLQETSMCPLSPQERKLGRTSGNSSNHFLLSK